MDVRQTEAFRTWLAALKDRRALQRIQARLTRLRLGLFGDAKSVGGRVSELRIDYGPGYRVYFTRVGDRLVILLAGGDKRTQANDIRRAQELAAQWSDENGG